MMKRIEWFPKFHITLKSEVRIPEQLFKFLILLSDAQIKIFRSTSRHSITMGEKALVQILCNLVSTFSIFRICQVH